MEKTHVGIFTAFRESLHRLHKHFFKYQCMTCIWMNKTPSQYLQQQMPVETALIYMLATSSSNRSDPSSEPEDMSINRLSLEIRLSDSILSAGDKLRPCIWITCSALQLLRKKTISLTAFSRPCCLCWNLIKCYKWALI